MERGFEGDSITLNFISHLYRSSLLITEALISKGRVLPCRESTVANLPLEAECAPEYVCLYISVFLVLFYLSLFLEDFGERESAWKTLFSVLKFHVGIGWAESPVQYLYP